MRIVAGSLKGHEFSSPSGHKTHPMSEKVRGAIFNILGDIEGLEVLDAYAGSGAIAFEALSRGAKFATLIDNDKNAHFCAADNVKKLGLQNTAKVTMANISSWVDNNKAKQFDIIFCDPPYDAVKQSRISEVAELLKNNGLLVVSLPPTEKLNLRGNFMLEQQKKYGDATLAFYRKTG